MRATTVVALVLAITVQSAYSHLGLNLGFNTQKSLNLGGVIKGILGEVEVEKSLDVNIGHGNGINIQREGMISLGGGKWGFQKSGSISIGGGHGGISTTGKREGSINIEGGQNVYTQGQQSQQVNIHNKGHFQQNGGYEIGAQGSLNQNSGNYGQHSSVQNYHHGSSSSHFEQGQQSIPNEGHLNQIGGYEIGVQGSLTQNLGNDGQHSSVQNSHHGSSSSHFEQGQKSIPNEGHLNQIGGYEIGVQGILTQNSGNDGQHSSVQNSHLGSSSSHFEQGEFHQPGSGQITGHVQSQNVNFGQQGFEQSGHGQIGDIFSVNEDKKSGNVHISEAGESKIHVQQQGNKESSLGQITGHSGHQTGQIIYELNTPGQKDDNVQTGHVEKSNVQFGQRGTGESDHTHGKVENSKQAGDIIVVIKDQNGGKVHTSNDKNSNIHFGHGIESNYDQIVIDGSKQAGDIIVVIKDKNSGKVDSSHDGSKNIHFKEEGVAQSVLNQVTGSSEHKTNDHNLVITGENSGTVHNSQESNKGVTGHSEDKTNDYDFKLHGQDGENVHKIVNQNSKINSEHGSGRGQSQLEQNQFQSQVQLGQGQVHQQSQSGLVQGQVQTQFQLGKGQDQKQLKSGDNQFQSQVQLGQGQVQQQSKSGLVQGQVQTQFQLGKGKDQKQLKSGDNQFQSQVQFGTGKGSKGSGLNQIFGFHKAGEILFGFEKPIGHDGHNEIEYNSNRQLNVNRKSPEEESIDVTSVTDNKNSLVVLNEDEHTSNIKMGVNNQNSAKKSISEHGNEHSSIGAVGHHAIGHDSTGQMQVTKEMLNSEEKSHHSESSESSSHFKQGLWNLGFGYNKKVEKQSKVEVNHHQESSSSVSQSHSSVQNHSQSSHKSSFHVESSHSSNKFH
uniref:Teratocyte protein VII n=1 Tax=Cotesia flavipes TaxID=89805 RepID=A0A8K1YTW0_COTFL|nr:teratocyte protein VII [Cotesia flavipes]